MTPQPASRWFRVHRSDSPAIQFGLHSHHRFSHPRSPYRVLYLGSSLSTCLWEYFGDDVLAGDRVISASKWRGCRLSRVSVPALDVCACVLESTRRAMGVDKSSLLASDLDVPQMWALAIQEHPAGFAGIQYHSRFVDESCLALWDRAGMAGRVRETSMGSLDELEGAVDWLDSCQAALL